MLRPVESYIKIINDISFTMLHIGFFYFEGVVVSYFR